MQHKCPIENIYGDGFFQWTQKKQQGKNDNDRNLHNEPP